MNSVSSEPPRRLSALDGLRGIAALVVVAHHLVRVLPSVASNYLNQTSVPRVGSWLWFVQYTPLKALTAGDEAVLIFFVLSGFVLSLAPLTRRSFDWVAYFPRRIIRLFIPTLAALVVACAFVALVPRFASSIHGPWLESLYVAPLTVGGLAGDATILFGNARQIDGAMWSLVWEVWFSLLLPLFVALVVLFKRMWWLALAAAFVACVIGEAIHQPALFYLSIFIFGVALALGSDDLRRVARRIDSLPHRRLIWWAILVVGILGVVWRWLLFDHLPQSTVLSDFVLPITGLSAALVVACCAFWASASRFLTWRPVAWLGRISFSLYLVHLPIILAAAFFFGDEHWPIVVLVAVPTSFVTAWLFYKFVESPAHRLSLRVGNYVGRANSRAELEFDSVT